MSYGLAVGVPAFKSNWAGSFGTRDSCTERRLTCLLGLCEDTTTGVEEGARGSASVVSLDALSGVFMEGVVAQEEPCLCFGRDERVTTELAIRNGAIRTDPIIYSPSESRDFSLGARTTPGHGLRYAEAPDTRVGGQRRCF